MKNRLVIIACVLICMTCVISLFAAGCATEEDLGEDVAETEESEENEPEDSSEGSGASVATSEGDKAPDFTAKLAGGGEFTLSDHKDDVVLINFWATWCGYCIDEMPDLEKLSKENINGLEIVMVDCMETKDEVDAFLKENGYTFTVAYDEDGSIESKYPTSGIPYTVIIKDGVVAKTVIGAPRDPYNHYKSIVEELL